MAERTSPTPARRPGLGPAPAVALVFGASAAVLVVELVALRLLAPFYGLTRETSTFVIGTALAAIAAGSWAGGRAADVVPPRHLLGPLLGIAGVVVAATPFLVRGAGASGDAGLLLLATVVCILVPGGLLSAVTPVVVKLRLGSLDETGTVVGRLSAIGTVGTIVGTVVTGFVLISRVPVSGILTGLGVACVVASVLVQVRTRRSRRDVAMAAAVAVAGVGAVAAQAVASVVAVSFPPGEPLDAYHIGGGGLTVPRYLAAVRPGTSSLVSEIDPGVVRVDTERLGPGLGEGIDLRVEEARLALGDLEPAGFDLVVGDAFGGVSVPWHLATVEAVTGVRRALAPDGVYVANLIDHGPLAFARAAVATTAEVTDDHAPVDQLLTPYGS